MSLGARLPLLRNLLAGIAILAWMTGLAAAAEALPEQFRATVRQIVLSSGIENPGEKAQAIRKALAEDTSILRWIAEGNSPLELLEAADLSPDAAWLSRVEQLKRIFALNKGSSAYRALQSTLKSASSSLATIPSEQRLSYLAKIPDSSFAAIGDSLSLAIREFPISRTRAIADLTNPQVGFDLSVLDPDRRALLQRVLGGYFDKMNIEDRRRVLAGLLELPPGANIERKIGKILQNSGPGIQKLFQYFGKDTDNPELRALMEDLLGNITPMEPEVVRRELEARLGTPMEKVFNEFDYKPLGAGTIGQAHRARLLSTGEEVVIKIRRPGIVEQALREMDVMQELVAGRASHEEVVRRIKDSLMAEMDFRTEAENMKKGRAYNSARLALHSVGSPKGFPIREDVIAQTFAKGKKLSKLGPEQLDEHAKALVNLLDRWFDEAEFKSGFFHGDLHPDNLIFQQSSGTDPPFVLNIIDFGSADTLTVNQRRGFARLFIGAYTDDLSAMIAGIDGLAPMPEANRARFLEALGRQDFKSLSVTDRINVIVAEALDAEARLPSAFLKFNRGLGFLEGQLADIAKQLDLKDPGHRIRRISSDDVLRRVGMREGLKELSRQPFSAEARKRSTITLDLAYEGLVSYTRQAAQAARDRCRAYFASLTFRKSR